MKPKLAKAGWFGITLLSVGVAVFSYRYLASLGFVPPNVAANRYFNPSIIVHAGAASTALLLGPIQFVGVVRQRRPKIHRWTGWAYVMSCLVGGMSGFMLARGVSTGPISAIGFGALAILWLYVTARGLLKARSHQFTGHRRWMIRSFALTFAAVTLRLYIPVSQILDLDFISAYRVIAWLAWVPNALFAEWYLGRTNEEPAHSLIARRG